MTPRRSAIGAGVLAASAAGMLAFSGAAHADSPVLYVYTNGVKACAAQWHSSSDYFTLKDEHQNNHYCYLKWGWTSSLGYRTNDKTDSTSVLDIATNHTTQTYVYWQFCEEESGGPDVCDNQRSDIA